MHGKLDAAVGESAPFQVKVFAAVLSCNLPVGAALWGMILLDRDDMIPAMHTATATSCMQSQALSSAQTLSCCRFLRSINAATTNFFMRMFGLERQLKMKTVSGM